MIVRIIYLMLNMVGLSLSSCVPLFQELTDESVSCSCRASYAAVRTRLATSISWFAFPSPGKPHPTLINDVSMWALSLYVKSTDDYAHL